MQEQIMSIFTRTPLHVGAGSSVGAVDQPVVRERHTEYPVIPGSSLKGVLSSLWYDSENMGKNNKRLKESAAELLFGRDGDDKNAKAGSLLVGEGKLLAFPVRSAKNAFAWCTCPLVLARAKRDMKLAFDIPKLASPDECIASPKLLLKQSQIVLEEYILKSVAEPEAALVTALQEISADIAWQTELAEHLVVISNEMFSYFAEHACEIAQHVKIVVETGVAQAGALFNQVNVPSETMFYSIMHCTVPEAADLLAAKLEENDQVLQIGADAGSGLGWCSVKLSSKGNN
ncbi:MAG: type III-B CRISPR module RAMP protein Cmr4 [Lentisphaerae bacterium]|nr:type III-B CRISPR module RAMP protein Cmr4 [Lentisphaerota bacterium]